MSDTSFSSKSAVWESGKINRTNFQPVLIARQNNFIANATGDGTIVTVPFSNIIKQNGNNFDTSTGLYTFPVSGIYYLKACVTCSGVTSSHTSQYSNFRTTTNVMYTSHFNMYTNSDISGVGLIYGAVFYEANMGDAAKFEVQVLNGTKVVSIVGPPLSPYTTHISINLMT